MSGMATFTVSTTVRPRRVCSDLTRSILAILLFNDSEGAIAEGIVHRMVKRAIEMEGTVSGEHGVGLVKRDYLDHELGESTVDTMRKVREDGPCPIPISHSLLT